LAERDVVRLIELANCFIRVPDKSARHGRQVLNCDCGQFAPPSLPSRAGFERMAGTS
jgi:hypothetical protein